MGTKIDLELTESFFMDLGELVKADTIVEVNTPEGAEVFTKRLGPSVMCLIAYAERHRNEVTTCEKLGAALGLRPAKARDTIQRLISYHGATLHDSWDGKMLLVNRGRHIAT